MLDLTLRSPRRDDTGADATSLERAPRLDPPPVPQWSGLFLEPDLPPAVEE